MIQLQKLVLALAITVLFSLPALSALPVNLECKPAEKIEHPAFQFVKAQLYIEPTTVRALVFTAPVNESKKIQSGTIEFTNVKSFMFSNGTPGLNADAADGAYIHLSFFNNGLSRGTIS